MSKGKSDKKPEATAVASAAPPTEKPEVKAAPADAKAPPAADAKADAKEVGKKQRPEPLLTFSRYFAHTGKPDHHQAGMAAWLKKRGWTSGRQTLAKWEKLFASY